jgi:hypothetical protein
MKEIYNTILRGSSRERLSILSDIFTIAGISIAAILAPIVSQPSVLSFSSYIQIAINVIVAIAAIVIVIGLGVFLTKGAEIIFNSSKISYMFASVVIWCFVLIGILIVLGLTHSVLTQTMWS